MLRQRIGIPMGTNCAVFVANFFCFTYEYAFIERLVTGGHTVLLSQFRYTLRYIDDLLSGANPEFSNYLSESYVDANGIRGIYPSFLTVTSEQDSTTHVSFLDTYVMFEGGRWFTKLYDKREHPPLSRVKSKKYPHVSCFLSDRSKYGIITSRLYSISRVCQRKSDFVERSRIFLTEFGGRGYRIQQIRSFVVRFLKTVPIQFPIRSRRAMLEAMMPKR